MYNIIIVGAGGFGREIFEWIKVSFPLNEYQIKGFLSPNDNDLDGFSIASTILGHEDSYEILENDRFICAIGNIELKVKIIHKLKQKSAKFITLIHPTALVASTARLGEGAIICPFVTVSDHAVIDDFVMMHFYSSCGHDAKIGKYAILSPYATVNGFTTLHDEVFLGTHSTVVAYKNVGYRAKISANSVAMYDVPDYAFVYGVPGKTQKNI